MRNAPSLHWPVRWLSLPSSLYPDSPNVLLRDTGSEMLSFFLSSLTEANGLHLQNKDMVTWICNAFVLLQKRFTVCVNKEADWRVHVTLCLVSVTASQNRTNVMSLLAFYCTMIHPMQCKQKHNANSNRGGICIFFFNFCGLSMQLNYYRKLIPFISLNMTTPSYIYRKKRENCN